MGGRRSWVDVLFGSALAVNMVLVPIAVVVPVLDSAAGAATLVAAAIGLVRVRPMQHLLGIVLIGGGVAAVLAALLLGGRPSIGQLLTLNQTLLGMLTAVSFVRLITGDHPVHEPRFTGVASVWRTAAVVQLLGAVINVSAVTLVGDRLRRRGELHMTDALLLSRAYSPGAFWSPFWGASAAALTYAGGASTAVLLICGGLLAFCAFTVSVALVIPEFRERLVGYRGYPLSARVLILPTSLAVIVIGFHLIVPSVRLAVVVLLASLLVPALVLAITKTRHLFGILGGHVVHGLRPMHGEAALFTGAGVLSVGLRVLFDTLGMTMPVAHYTVWLAWASVLAMTLVSLIGVHPVISIAVTASLLGPAILPEQTMFALAGTIAWGTAAAVGPISGLNVFLAGRFGVSGFDVARRNLPYLVVVAVFALPALALCAKLT